MFFSFGKILIRLIGQNTVMARPTNLSRLSVPQYLLSNELPRLSPIIKYSSSPSLKGPHFMTCSFASSKILAFYQGMVDIHKDS